MKEYYEFKSSNYGIGNSRLKNIIGFIDSPDTLKILDIGCAGGVLGNNLMHLGHSVHGVEISKTAAATAKKYLDKVFVFDVMGNWPEEVCNIKYDIVIISEVIEHLFDPEIVLKKIWSILNENGIMILTTPNFLVWTNRIRFLFSIFNYKSEGMFDYGHIRWFTHSSLKQLLLRTGFIIVKENNIIFPKQLRLILKYFPSIFSLQFIIKTKKSREC